VSSSPCWNADRLLSLKSWLSWRLPAEALAGTSRIVRPSQGRARYSARYEELATPSSACPPSSSRKGAPFSSPIESGLAVTPSGRFRDFFQDVRHHVAQPFDHLARVADIHKAPRPRTRRRQTSASHGRQQESCLPQDQLAFDQLAPSLGKLHFELKSAQALVFGLFAP
jgi:hypothetical protein